MNATKLFSTVILISALILSSALWNGCSAQGLNKGDEAPNFTLENLKGDKISLSNFKDDKAVLLVFWATWCPYCVEEIPLLKKIYSKYQAQGLEILAVSLRESKEKLTSFAKKNGINYAILIDPEGNVGTAYGVVGIPTNVIVSKKGIIEFKGNALPNDYESLIEKVLK